MISSRNALLLLYREERRLISCAQLRKRKQEPRNMDLVRQLHLLCTFPLIVLSTNFQLDAIFM